MMSTSSCPSCGRKLTTYYGEHCFFCKKPEPEVVVRYNYFETKYWLLAHDLITEDEVQLVWNYMCEYCNLRNDSTVVVYHVIECAPEDDTDKALQKFLNEVYKMYNIPIVGGEFDISFWVSW